MKFIQYFKRSRKVCKYTEYKLSQWKFIQTEFAKNTSKGVNIEMFSILCYQEYLDIIGLLNNDIRHTFKLLSTKVQTYWIEIGSDSLFAHRYCRYTAENIDTIMDNLLPTILKNKKF